MLFCLQNDDGLTLVEVVVTLALIAIVIVSVVATVVQSATFSDRIDKVYTASYLAQRRIDLLKRFDFDEVQSAEETDIRVGADGTIDPDGDYIRTTGVYTDTNPYLLKIQVSVDLVIDDTPTGSPIVMETYFVDSDEDMIYMHGE